MKRDERGRFLPGNEGGPGNPYIKRVAALRKALLEAVTPEDIVQVVAALIEKAKKGDVNAAKILFDRTFGPPTPADITARVEELEQILRGDR